jgi:hypothetical protein
MEKLSVLRMEQRAKCMGDRPVSLTTSMYFDMKIWMIRLEIRVESGNCQTIQIFENMEIQKNLNKFLVFFQ